MQGFSACELSQYLTTLVLKLLSSIVHDVLPNHISTFGANNVLIIIIHSYPNMNTYIHILYTHSGCSRVFQHQHKSVGSMVSMMVPAKHIAGLSLLPLFLQVHLQALEVDGQQDFVVHGCHFVCLTLAWGVARVPSQLLAGVLWHLCRKDSTLYLSSVRESGRKP